MLRKRWSDATAISMADLTGVAVTDAFCYRLRRWRTDSPSRKGEARRGATHSPLEGWMHSPSSSVASLVFRKCLLSQMYNIANKSLKTHNEPESIKKKTAFLSSGRARNEVAIYLLHDESRGLYVCRLAAWRHHGNAFFLRQLIDKANMSR